MPDDKPNFDTYLRHDEMTEALRRFAEEHTAFSETVSVGESYEGRDIWLAELTNRNIGPASEKPAFWVDGGAHAREVTGSMAALYPTPTNS